MPGSLQRPEVTKWMLRLLKQPQYILSMLFWWPYWHQEGFKIWETPAKWCQSKQIIVYFSYIHITQHIKHWLNSLLSFLPTWYFLFPFLPSLFPYFHTILVSLLQCLLTLTPCFIPLFVLFLPSIFLDFPHPSLHRASFPRFLLSFLSQILLPASSVQTCSIPTFASTFIFHYVSTPMKQLPSQLFRVNK